MNSTTRSKFLSLILRHDPGRIGLVLDSEGWAGIDELLTRAAAHGVAITRSELEAIIATSDKQRFALSSDGRRIRANQGHSVTVDLNLVSREPPPELFHGTVERFVPAIRREGLRKGKRHHVHLSGDRATAEKVGARRGSPVILLVDAAAMAARGFTFYQSENGVWLTDHVPPEFLREM